jgi:hypothetical protein
MFNSIYYQCLYCGTYLIDPSIIFLYTADLLIIYGLTSCSRIFHLYGDIIAGEGLQNLGLILLGTQGLWAGEDFYRATPTVAGGLGFSGLIRRTTPFNRLLCLIDSFICLYTAEHI